MNCTSCNKELDSVLVKLNVAFSVERLTDADTWEKVPNSISNPKEVLCKECFSLFVDLIDENFNKEETDV